ncbi:GNAT family N-acetyltransferase [Pseudoalteromonas umbrosa]|uniref:GNAT family N-acetyltransferase n=1 Tax=Pseudoalteromonas umbrosa TaxID=3048489 RepID=UPI0024C2E9A0|nr:GNAT family protein [Pseudoalteromonas sp. B95]MDK1289368.1 GNAT family protein [Pseudoalteromonas sp. B95]
MSSLFTTQRLCVYHCQSLLSKPNHAQQITHILTPAVTAFLPKEWQSPPLDEHAVQWLSDKLKEADIFIAMSRETTLKDRTLPIGLTLFHRSGDTAHIGYLIAEQAWGQGFGSELLSGLMTYLAYTTSIKTVFAGVDPHNKGSIRALEKCHFHLDTTAKDGQNAFYVYHF